MIRLKSLTLRAFRSFQEETTIEFPSNGFILIDGLDLDTGGSSGAGKTSVVEAIAYALGYARLPATELQNRNTKTPMQVKLQVSNGLCIIEIARGEKNYIKYLSTGQMFTGSKPIAEELIRVLGLPIDLIEALTYRPQRSFGRFVSMTDAEKKDFLTNCLPELQDIERVAEAARVTRDAVVIQLQQVSDNIVALEAELGRHLQNDPSVQLKPVDCTDLEGRIVVADLAASTSFTAQSEAQDALSDYTYSFNADIARLSTDILIATNPIVEGIAASKLSSKQERVRLQTICIELNEAIRCADAQRKKEADVLRAEISTRRASYNTLAAVCAKNATTEEAMAKLSSQIETLRANICPTCERTWPDGAPKLASLEVEKAGLEQKLVLIREAGVRLVTATNDIDALEAQLAALPTTEIDKLKATHLDLTKEFYRVEAEIKAFDVETDRVRQEANAKCTLESAGLRNRLAELASKRDLLSAEHQARKNELASAKAQLESARASNANITAQIQRHRETVERVNCLLEGERSKVTSLKTTIALESSIHQALGRGGYLGRIFDEILVEIGHEVSSVLAMVPNVSSVSLKFVSSHDTKKGTTKRSIVPLITKNGYEAPLGTLSGGQQASIELAVDLAVGNVISRRTGRTPGWIVIDEGFDGLDMPAKEACMEVLKRYAVDRLVVVIDHFSELKELFDRQIVIEMRNGASTLRS